MKTIGESIRQCRLKRGYSMAKANQKTGIWKRDLYRYERNQRIPSLFTALTLADAYRVSLDELVGRTEGSDV